MSAPETIDSAAANQRALGAAVARLRSRLEGSASGSGPGNAIATEPATVSAPPALEQIASRFRLSAFERDLLLLVAAPEMDSQFAELLARLHGDPRRRHATFGLALGTLPDAHWSALGPEAPLRRWRLIEVGTGEGLIQCPLRVDERILHYLCGVPARDDRLRPIFHALAPHGLFSKTQQDCVEACTRHLRSATAPLVLQLASDSASDARSVAAAAAAELGAALFLVDAHDLPESAAEREALARLWEREVALTGALAAIEMTGGDAEERRALAWLDQLQTSALLLARSGAAPRHQRLVRVDLPRLSAEELPLLWNAALGQMAGRLNGEVTAVSREFRLGTEDIRFIAGQLHAEFPSAPGAASAAGSPRASRKSSTSAPRGDPPRRLRALCRARARAPLEALAQRLEPSAGWEDLVLPAEARQRLKEIVMHARHSHRVGEEWGFAARGPRGLGLSALFSGPSGTGKTLSAEVLARDLDLELFRIDLSAVVSKYIGETEKNLRRIFDAAESGVAILLFDEADALFGKRTEVKDSHDRYANIEVSYLLQRMEAYRGIAILTTNLKASLDTAFLRRLRFVVQFPFPDAAQRAEIWRRVFPSQTPTEGLEPRRLAQLNVAGGHIRNIALGAAVLAADAGEPVRMKHLHDAARAECAKLERPASDSEFAGWLGT